MTAFNEAKRDEYLGYLREGSLKFEASRRADVSYRTIQRYRSADPEFRELEAMAMLESVEEVENVVRTLALAGDLKAAEMWLKAHARSVYGAEARLTVDATEAAVELSRNEAMARLAAAREKIEDRRKVLEEATDVIDVDPLD